MSESSKQPLIGDLTGMAQLADSKVANKLYDDALSAPAKEVGGLGVDVLKTLRLFTAPIQLAAAYQDRLAAYLDEVRRRVPVERQQDAAPSIAGPVIRDLIFIEDESPLRAMYLELLTRAIDSERSDEAHPAFAKIISQLSPDEARLLVLLRGNGGYGWRRYDHYPSGQQGNSKTYSLLPQHAEFDLMIDGTELSGVCSIRDAPIYFEHLMSLNVLRWVRERPSGKPLYRRRPGVPYDTAFTLFGMRFIEACVPDSLPRRSSGESSG